MKQPSAYMDLDTSFNHLAAHQDLWLTDHRRPEPMSPLEQDFADTYADGFRDGRNWHMSPIVLLAVFVCSLGAHALLIVVVLKLAGLL